MRFIKLTTCGISITLMATALLAQDVARMDKVVQPFATNKTFMGSVLVARENKVLLNKSYGFATLEWNVPNSPTTKFSIASATKQFTAASILLLEERGELKTSDAVKNFIPDAPPAWDRITLHHLLTHTSGIPNFSATADFLGREAPEKLLKRFRDQPLVFQPGEKFEYSNSGYILLGYLIEKLTGESYQKFVQENIFTPLGMKDSGYDTDTVVIPRRAVDYFPGKDGPEHAGFFHFAFSAGGLYSTTEDLLRWERGLFGGKLLSTASLAKMIAPVSHFPDEPSDLPETPSVNNNAYAMGLMPGTLNGHKLIQHSGGDGHGGSRAFLVYFPDDRLTVLVLANLDKDYAVTQIALRIAALVLNH